MKSSKSIAVWVLASALCVITFWHAFDCWFLMDDFAWLGLKQEIASHQEANGQGWKLLVEPRAQGTTRVFSERLYFWGLHTLFGLDPLPFRILAFAFQFLNLWWIVRIALRLTQGNLAAASTASCLFAVAACGARPLAWASSFNQVLAASAMLAALTFYLDWLENGRPRDWWIQFAIFVVSFGVLESAIMYPVAITLWTLLAARTKLLRGALPLWIPSLVFGLMHLFLIKHSVKPAYTPLFDLGILTQLARYTQLALFGPVLPVVLLVGVAWRAWKYRDWVPAFFCAWYVLFLAPVLPLQNQLSDYYLFLPTTGLALAFGSLVRDRLSEVLAMLVVCGFTAVSLPEARAQVDWLATRSARFQKVFEAGEQLQQTKKIDTLILSGADTDLFRTALQDRPFRLIGIEKVYLAPGSESAIRVPREDASRLDAYQISLAQGVASLESGRAAVLSITGDKVYDATARYRGVAMSQYLQTRPRAVNVGEPGYEPLLGPGWYPIEDKFRWMGKSASLTLGAPVSPKSQLQITGFCPDTVAKQGPVTLTVRIDGKPVGSKLLDAVAPFSLSLPIDKTAAPTVTVDLEVNRTTRLAGDKRELGLIFGTFQIQP